MALVCDPRILFLDEPSAGLDPENRGRIWRMLQGLRSPDRFILLTTHSMEEAEVLCNRVGILARGSLQCIGSSQHLKEKYGRVYTLKANMVRSNESRQFSQEELANFAKRLDDFVRLDLGAGRGELVSITLQTRKYSIPKDVISLSAIYEKMDLAQSVCGVKEWSVNQSSLEEVFITAVTIDELFKGAVSGETDQSAKDESKE